MIRRTAAAALLTCILVPGGCMRPLSAGQPGSSAIRVRNQGYALLYALVVEVSQVDMLLIIRNPSPEVAGLVKAIATFAGEAEDTLEAIAAEDPRIGFDRHGLPDMEVRTRNAIGEATADDLLFNGGKEFEFRVLLSQHQALTYMAHLARQVAEQETSETRKRALEHIAGEAEALHEQVLARLMEPYVGESLSAP